MLWYRLSIIKEEQTWRSKEQRRWVSSSLQRPSQYHASFRVSGGGQAFQIPITAQHVFCSLVPLNLASICPLCPDEIREGQSLVWIDMWYQCDIMTQCCHCKAEIMMQSCGVNVTKLTGWLYSYNNTTKEVTASVRFQHGSNSNNDGGGPDV